MVTVFLIAGIVAALIFVFYIARRSVLSSQGYDELNKQLIPVDIAAFRNLVDVKETQYLRENLAPVTFRRVQRQRQLAALGYVRAVARNAAILIAMAQPAMASPNREVAIAAQHLVHEALQLRIRSLLSILKLYVGIFLPGMTTVEVSVAEHYQNVSSGFASLIHMRSVAPADSTEGS